MTQQICGVFVMNLQWTIRANKTCAIEYVLRVLRGEGGGVTRRQLWKLSIHKIYWFPFFSTCFRWIHLLYPPASFCSGRASDDLPLVHMKMYCSTLCCVYWPSSPGTNPGAGSQWSDTRSSGWRHSRPSSFSPSSSPPRLATPNDMHPKGSQHNLFNYE